MNVRELIEVSPRFLIKVNGADYDTTKDHYADDWIVKHQDIEIYTYLALSSSEPAEVKNSTMCMYLCISAEEVKE